MARKKPTGDHKLAIEVSKLEGGKQNLTIAQIKEVIRCLRKLSEQVPHRVLSSLFKL